MKKFLLGIARFAKRHPYVTYGIVAIPACFLMCTGALAIQDGYYDKDHDKPCDGDTDGDKVSIDLSYFKNVSLNELLNQKKEEE